MSNIRQIGFNAALGILKASIGVLGPKNASGAAARIVEELTPTISTDTPHGPIRFFCPGPLAIYRARTLLTKEPETIAWIDSFDADDTFWDIGANVGVYSLYAGRKGTRTVAFEPAAGNYYLLNRNIEINRLAERVTALCIALSDTTGLAAFHMQNTELGSALNSFDEALDWRGDPLVSRFQQGMVGYDIDRFIAEFAPPFPTHIKIDVDGREGKIIEGARQTFSDPRLRSVLSELDGGRDEYCREVIDFLASCGLRLVQKGHRLSVDGAPEQYYIYIFRRDVQP